MHWSTHRFNLAASRSTKLDTFYAIPYADLAPKLSFRNALKYRLEYDANIDDTMVRMMTGNVTWWRKGSSGYELFPFIDTDAKDELAMTTSEDNLTWVACGSRKKSRINFEGYIAAYDTWTWIYVVILYVGLSVFLQMNDWLKLNKLTVDVDTRRDMKAKPFFMGIKVSG